LTYQLSKEFAPVDLKPVESKKVTLQAGVPSNTIPPGFYNPKSEEEEDDESEWICPSNIKSLHGDKSIKNEESVKVACMTSDFAIQNVIQHMGLHVLSIDGLIIKQNKTYILRCHACFKTTSIMTKVFCPNCGNKTLKRVAIEVNEDGEQTIFISRRPLNVRGTKYSLPTPTGGKHAHVPLLCEDQRLPQQRQSNMSKMKTDALSPDYAASVSPFAINDVYSKAAHIGNQPKYFDRKNPNQVPRPIGRKQNSVK